jgi:hypothetical protein
MPTVAFQGEEQYGNVWGQHQEEKTYRGREAVKLACLPHDPPTTLPL